MPKSLYAHAMLNFNGNLVVIGGDSGLDKYQSSLLVLSCYDGHCQWQTMPQQLKTARSYFVAFTVPDSFVDCCDTSKDPNCFKVCKEGEVRNKTSNRCISISSLCNGNGQNCSNATWECQNQRQQQFILSAARCDGEDDCIGGSDEHDCNNCTENAWLCNDGSKCIKMEQKCDGEKQCKDDGSDEDNCVCLRKDVECKDNSTCIRSSWMFDGEKDCADVSDELINPNLTCTDNICTCKDGKRNISKSF